ncbi:MAG: hypothetical protein LCH61_08790 [Proteobacteria bacterium]|nr:hypothetical protein [Pseudomonadota bacterium]
MAIVVQCLGVVMALGGLIGLVYGVDMLPTERGIAGTIGSMVALAGGTVTAALGVLIQRIDGLKSALAAAPRTVAPRIAVEEARARVEPPVVEPIPPPPVVADVAEPPPPPRVEPRLPDSAPVVQTGQPKFKLPSFKIGAGAVAAGAATGAAATGAALARAGTEATAATDAAVARIDAAVDRIVQAEPVEPPVEILTPVPLDPPVEAVADDLPRLLPEVDAGAYAPMPLPEETAVVVNTAVEDGAAEIVTDATPQVPSAPAKAAEEDPFAAFDAELDKLIPLKTGRKGKGRKEPAPDLPAAKAMVAPTPEATAAEEPAAAESPALPVPADIIAEPADIEPVLAPSPDAEIVGAYESGGAKYTMYSDGSVVAEADGQSVFFKSLEELRSFIDGGAKG